MALLPEIGIFLPLSPLHEVPLDLSSGIEITRLDLTSSDLRKAAGKSRDAKASRRMLALALVLEGVGRMQAAQSCGMDRQTLR